MNDELKNAIQNILTTDYSDISVTMEVTDESVVTAEVVVNQLKEKLLYPPRFRVLKNDHKRFNELDSFVESELDDVVLSKCTKQMLLDRIRIIKKILMNYQ